MKLRMTIFENKTHREEMLALIWAEDFMKEMWDKTVDVRFSWDLVVKSKNLIFSECKCTKNANVALEMVYAPPYSHFAHYSGLMHVYSHRQCTNGTCTEKCPTLMCWEQETEIFISNEQSSCRYFCWAMILVTCAHTLFKILQHYIITLKIFYL